MIRNKRLAGIGLALATTMGAIGAMAATGALSGGPAPTASKGITVVAAPFAPLAAGPVAATSAPGDGAAAFASYATGQGTPVFSFGVQTHFFQGWHGATSLRLADQVGARMLRDTVPWTTVETRPGVYAFTAAPLQTLASFCAGNGKLILTILPKNPLYDGGRAVSSDAGQTAYANYVKAVLDRFGSCVSAIEVGNEINNSGALDYPAGMDKPRTYVALLRKLKQLVKPAHPGAVILGGSTNAIGTGFLEKLFAAGALDAMDGVAVHPYRSIGEGVDDEIEHLRDVMRRYGRPVPIWATEFSIDTPDQVAGAAGLVKTAALLNASGVDHASWYALVDQKWFPNMGLFTGTTAKPSGLAYAAIMRRLFPFGRATRVDTGDNLVYLYRFGTNRWLAWGAGRTITFTGSPAVSDMYGNPRPGTTVRLGSEPVIVEGATSYSLGDGDVVADTMMQYGRAPWTYLRRSKAGGDVVLPVFDTDYTSHFGDRWSKPLRINILSAATAGTAANPIRAVVRYTATQTQRLDLDLCLGKEASGDGIDWHVLRNGVSAAGGILTDKAELRALPIDVSAGDRIELVFGPNQTAGGDAFRYRARLSLRGRGTALCS